MHYKIGKMLFKEAKDIREKVFVEEQHFENEFDDIDSWAIHLVVYDKEAIGCARMYDDNGVMILGRIAVLKEKRALHAGSYILSVLEKHARELGYHEVVLSAQLQAKPFYAKNGYISYGDVYYDEHTPHIHMKKK